MVAMPAFDLKKLERDRIGCWDIFYENLPRWIDEGLHGHYAVIGPNLGQEGRAIATFKNLLAADFHIQTNYWDIPLGHLLWRISRSELDEANRPPYNSIPANTNTTTENLEQIL